MSYFIPVDGADQSALIIPGLSPSFQTNHNCRFIFIPDGAQVDLQQTYKNYEREWKYHLDWHPLIVLIEATPSGKGTKVKLVERRETDEGVLWHVARECEVMDVLHQNPWWVSVLPLGYVVTVPLDVVSFPVQAPFIYVGWRISRTMSAR
jgi:hypothetical protein